MQAIVLNRHTQGHTHGFLPGVSGYYSIKIPASKEQECAQRTPREGQCPLLFASPWPWLSDSLLFVLFSPQVFWILRVQFCHFAGVKRSQLRLAPASVSTVMTGTLTLSSDLYGILAGFGVCNFSSLCHQTPKKSSLKEEVFTLADCVETRSTMAKAITGARDSWSLSVCHQEEEVDECWHRSPCPFDSVKDPSPWSDGIHFEDGFSNSANSIYFTDMPKGLFLR